MKKYSYIEGLLKALAIAFPFIIAGYSFLMAALYWIDQLQWDNYATGFIIIAVIAIIYGIAQSLIIHRNNK